MQRCQSDYGDPLLTGLSHAYTGKLNRQRCAQSDFTVRIPNTHTCNDIGQMTVVYIYQDSHVYTTISQNILEQCNSKSVTRNQAQCHHVCDVLSNEPVSPPIPWRLGRHLFSVSSIQVTFQGCPCSSGRAAQNVNRTPHNG
jgi:hypothetical protein